MGSFYEQHPYTITENCKNSVRIKDTKGQVDIRNKAHVKQYFQKLIKISCTTQYIIESNYHDMENDFITLHVEEPYETNNTDADETMMKLHLTCLTQIKRVIIMMISQLAPLIDKRAIPLNLAEQ